MHDLVIRGGSVVDGTGAPQRTADVAISDGVVTEVGRVSGEARETLDADGSSIGTVTSGGFGPTVGGPVAMGYVAGGHRKSGTMLQAMVRGKHLPTEVVRLPFVERRYYRG